MPGSTTSQIPVTRFETAALLKALNIPFVGAELSDAGRAVLYFENEDGRAEEVLRSHERGGVPVNSSAFEEGLRWAKDKVFSARRAAGLF